MVNYGKSQLLDAFFPQSCCLCGLRSHNSLPLCQACRNELQPNSCHCSRCALPLPPAHEPEEVRLCGRCLLTAPPFHRVIAPWLYNEHLAHIIQRWKYGRERQLTPLLASLWLAPSAHSDDLDLLIPVPLHWRKLWQRGFNQSELLCRALRASEPSLAKIPLDPRRARRRRYTRAQSGMDARQRALNLRHAFTARRSCANLRVAVVDDVLTTGATASALATALTEAGASRVEVWCLARTPAPG